MSEPQTTSAFRDLHASGCFVLPNPWDVGSAVYLAHLGFKALATSSAGFAFSRGRPDSLSALGLDEVLAHAREIVAATPLPVSVDFQHGYADTPEGIAANVARCLATGCAGLSIEDASGDERAPLYERALSIERVQAARAALDEAGSDAVLTARCEAWLVGDESPQSTAIDRLVAFADAGADCLFAPGVRDAATISAIVHAVAPRPVNVLMSAPAPGLSVQALAELGVRRISVGSALARKAWSAFMRAARQLMMEGSFDALEDAAPFSELNRVLSGR